MSSTATMADCTITEIAEAYREFRGIDCAPETLRVDEKALKAAKAMAAQMVSELAIPGANAHRARRSAAGASPCTINKEVESLRRMIDWAVAVGMCETNPLASMKRMRDLGTKKRRSFTLEEIHSMLAHMPGQWMLLFQLYLCTGMRNSEARCLPWAELDLEESIIRLPAARTKMRKDHAVMLGPRMIAKLQEIPHCGDYVFANPKTGVPYDATRPARVMKDAATAAGWSDLSGVSPQTLRRSFSKIAYKRAGKDAVMVGKLLGHKGDVTAECYIEIDDPEARAAVAKVEALVLGEEA